MNALESITKDRKRKIGISIHNVGDTQLIAGRRYMKTGFIKRSTKTRSLEIYEYLVVMKVCN